MTNNRTYHLDLAAGILMLWIITFHAVNGSKVFGPVDARVAIPYLTFAMPWFFYKSGAFFDTSRIKDGQRRDLRKLLLPYLRWTALGFAAYLVMMVIDGTVNYSECLRKPLDTLWIYGYLPLDVPLWFVLSLFAVKSLARLLSGLKIPPVVIVIVGLGIAFGLHIIDNPRIPVWLANIPMGMGFFALGHICHKYENRLWLLIPCIAGYVAFIICDTPVVGLHRNVHLGGNYYLWPVFAVCGIVSFNNLCKWVGSVLSKCSIHPVSFIGQHSITLLVSHAFVYYPVLHYSKLAPVQTFLLIESIYFFVLIPVIFAVSRHRLQRGR